MNPKVTVFMPIYNGEKYLKESIESVLQQSYPHFEFLLLNDGSSDLSQKIVDSYCDARIRCIKNAAPSGLKVARNQGLTAARGEYIAPIDCDDIWDPKRLEKQVSFLDAHPSFALIGARAIYIDAKGQVKGVAWRFNLSPQQIRPFLLFGNYFIHSSFLIRRSMLPEEGYQATTAEDYDLAVRISLSHPIWSLPDPLVKYRVHDGGDSYQQAVLTHRMQKQRRNIYLAQLLQLGLNPTLKELDTHDAIGHKQCATLEDLKEQGQWLLKIITANQRSNIYLSTALRQIILERWLMCCFCATNLGLFRVIRIYFSILLPKIALLNAPFQYVIPFLRYLKNKNLGKFP